MQSSSSRCNYWLVFAVLYGVVAGIESQQSVVDTIADSLDLVYTVEDNYQGEDLPGWYSRNTLTLTNSGDVDIGDDPWWIYFSHLRNVYNTYTKYPDGVPLGDSGLVAFHVNGWLHKMGPEGGDVRFLLKPSETMNVTLYSEAYQAAKTDIFPNWYVTMEGAEPRVLASTAGESLDFVSDFTQPQQYKRELDDQYEPYTAERRYDIYSGIQDKGAAQQKVIPTPVQESWDSQSVVVDDQWVVYTGEDSLKTQAKLLADHLSLTTTDSKPLEFFIELTLGSVDEAPDSNEEAYTLEITSDNVQVTGKTSDGVFRGIQSFRSLCESAGCTIPLGSVLDYPRFPYRGMEIDVSRNFHPKEDIFRLLNVMSMYKLNKLHLHLGDDEGWRVEIDGLQELTEVGAHRCHDESGTSCIMPQLGSGPFNTTQGSGFYTKEDYRGILTYANDRHIQVIPEIDMPGHEHAPINAMKARYNKYIEMNQLDEATTFLLSDLSDTARYKSFQYFTDNAINPCMESTYAFIKHVVEQLKVMHDDIQPLEVFHFGGDEVADGAWDDSAACEELLKNGEDLRKYFLTRVADILAELELNMAGWEDGFIGGGEPLKLEDLPQGPTYSIYSWNNVWEWAGGHHAYMMANAGYKAILSHATHFYFDHPYEPDPEELGNYWAERFIDTQKTFGYNAEDAYANIAFTRMGKPLSKEEICSMVRCDTLDEDKRDNIIGIQGQLWSELVRTSSQVDYMFYPRVLAVAERAWHKAGWEADEGDMDVKADWETFANTLGYKELGRLDELSVEYAVPPPGAMVTNNNGLHLLANTAYPGLPIHFSLDDGKTWEEYQDSPEVPPSTTIQVVTRSADGARSSRVVTLTSPPDEVTTPASGSLPLWSPLLTTLTVMVLMMVV